MKQLKTKKDIFEIIKQDKWMIEVLRIVKELDLLDWYIGAGFVRNKIWDYLHNYKFRTPLNDIDIIYFDKENIDEKYEKEYEEKLKLIDSKINWSVTNQARMWKINGHQIYHSSEEALSYWPETATCVGLRIDKNNKLLLISPHGINDLLNLTIRFNTLSNKASYKSRLKEKQWKNKWPKLKIFLL
ncbi:MAG TPA: nucleotidyltransferase family protein [Candidatus Nanoarchaeia archaeon]|nr:nucleotidyltransferase family protein [Candidatus Nanoarchaeia archaeon]